MLGDVAARRSVWSGNARETDVHGFGDDSARYGAQFMKIGVPELDERLAVEPTLVEKQAVDLRDGDG